MLRLFLTESISLTGEMTAVIAILGCTVFLFVSEVVWVDVAAVATIVIIGLTGLIPGYPGPVSLDNLLMDSPAT